MNSELVFNTMEVLETKPISELVTEATIKVCYVSEMPNRNGTVITKDVGKEIASTLPGAPVVGLFDEGSQDFVEHSRKITITDGEVKLQDLTRPYGFVSFDKPWYQDFIENGVNRTYLMCKAYLWTKQYKEAAHALNKGQSMELDGDSMAGYYEGDVFVFTHATLDRLCILGDKYEPCFEGARIFTTYARQYNRLAETVEDILGRRYFVHNGQLVPNMEKNTLKYALELGFNLHEAIMSQLMERGMSNYQIVGVFCDKSTGIYAILQNMDSLEYVKIGVEINADDTVALNAEVQAVTMAWVDKSPADETRVTPIQENPGATNADASSKDEQIARLEAELVALREENAAFKKKEEGGTESAKDGSVKGDGKGSKEETSDGGTEDASDGSVEKKDHACGDGSQTPSDKKKNHACGGKESAKDGSVKGDGKGKKEETADGGTEDASDGSVDKKKNHSLDEEAEAQYTAKIAELENQVAEYSAKISELETKVNEYTAAEKAAEDTAKQNMVASYAAMLSEEEIAPIQEKIGEYSLEEVESKLAVVYSRKMREVNKQENKNFQLNVQNTNTNTEINESIPSFMQKAMEYEQTHQF